MLKKVTLTFAQSLDGKIATTTGESRYISEEGSLELNQKMRREHDAIIVGIGTVIADDPMLTYRSDPDKSPLRVILDPSLRMSLQGKIAQSANNTQTLIFYDNQLRNQEAPDFNRLTKNLNWMKINLCGIPADSNGHLDLRKVLQELEKMGIQTVMVEGGSSVLTSFLKQDLWDELIIVSAAKIFGSGIPSFGDLGIRSLKEAILPEVKNISIIGNEVCWHLVKPEKKEPVSTKCVYFTAPMKVEVQTSVLDAPENGKKLYNSRIMAVSPGTEKKIYRGQFRKGKKADLSVDCIDTEFSYPFTYGYINIVENTRGERFFGFLHHAEKIYSYEKNLLPLDEDITDEAALFIPHMETALSIIHDTKPKLGDRLLITGAGVIGTLTSRILSQVMGIRTTVFDINPAKQSWFPENNFYTDISLLDSAGPFDICIDVSGSAEGLQTCIDKSEMEGSITVASWYGEKDITVNLGGNFHWKRLKLLSSQVSNMPLTAGISWNKQRRLMLAVDLLKKINTEDLLTHSYPLSDASEAFNLFNNNESFYGLIALTPGG